MKKETYVKMTQPFRDDPKRARALHRANKILTVVIFVAYPCLLLWLLWQKDMRLYKAICVPLDGFIIVTVVRAWINRKRPYEIFELPSVIPKDTKGHSWPSRHVFSAAVIAFTFWFVCPAVGIVFLLMTVAIAYGRHRRRHRLRRVRHMGRLRDSGKAGRQLRLLQAANLHL